MIAGPMFNFIFAILAFWLMYLIGVPGIKPIIGEVAPKSVAEIAGLQSGDQIIAINGDSTPTWSVARITLLDSSLDADEVTLQVRGKEGDLQNIVLPVANVSAEIKQKDLLGYLGIQPRRAELPAVLGKLETGGPAEKAGLKAGDRIVKANDQDLMSWIGVVKFIRSHPGQAIQLEIERDGHRQLIAVTPEKFETEQGVIGRIGAGPAPAGPLPAEMTAEVSANSTHDR